MTTAQRGKPGGFVADPDVMDTWATSSVTPQIAGGWLDDPDLFARVFPMDLRPQGHDIIRTWLFTTVLRSQLEHDALPWANASISGFVLDPDRKKMSKSKGNAVTPMAMLEQCGSDGVRYWAASVRPGGDPAFDPKDPGQMKVGRRLAMKILNAARFALLQSEPRGPITEPLDRGMLTSLSLLVTESTEQLEAYDYARVLERAERFFWSFCDDYLELVKARRYGDFTPEGAASANSAMLVALSTHAAVVRAVSAVCDRGGLVLVASRVGPSGGVADERGSGGTDRRSRRRGRRRVDAVPARVDGSSAREGAAQEIGQVRHRRGRAAVGVSRRSVPLRGTFRRRCTFDP